MQSPVIKILTKQAKELHEHPLPGIDAKPKEDNIKEWCGNVFFPESSPYKGFVMHFIVTFSDQYPTVGPNLRVLTTLNHTHVFGESCCFSLLPDFREYFTATGAPKSAYWNPARTVRGFLEGFYQFLVYDVDRVSHGRGDITKSMVDEALTRANNFKCGYCGHSIKEKNISPPCPTITEAEANKYNGDEDTGPTKALSEEEQSIKDLCCSISRVSVNDTIMGFGVNVTQTKNGPSSTSDLYPMSWETFHKDKIRMSAGGSPITHWIPFVINEKNWEKAETVAKESISLIATGAKDKFKPEQVLDVIGELWKNKAVEMMKGEEHASEKILIGFCAFHHLLLAFSVKTCKNLVQIATDRVKAFISSPQNRNKRSLPDFGRFLPVFLISSILWEDKDHAGRVAVSELFTRNAMWIQKEFGALKNPTVDEGRVTKSWGPSQVGLKLTCFQIRYILEVGRPMNETDLVANFERLNKLNGRPTAQMIQAFQNTVKKVQAIADYSNWFQAMGLGSPPAATILKMLQDGMQESKNNGYHK